MMKSRTALLKTSCLATAFAAFAAAPAHAQEAGESDADASRRLDTITVSTTRRVESLQDVPVAVTAITEDTIEQLKPRNLSDLTGLAPNTFIGQTTAVPGGGAIYIRGLGYSDVEKTQNPPAGVIIDGVFLGTNTGQLVDAFDIQQIDINRGPQGIFFGKNTTAGVVHVTRSAPTRELGFKGSAAYGSNDELIFKGIANFGLGEDGGVKIGATYRESDGFTENIQTGDTVDGFEYFGINAALDYDLTEWANVRLSYDRFDHEGGGTPVQYGNPFSVEVFSSLFGVDLTAIPGFNAETSSPAGLGVREVLNDFEDMDELTTNIYSGTLTFDTPVGELTSVSAYIDSEDLVFQDFDGTCSTLPNCPPGAVNILLASAANPTGTLHTTRDQAYEQFTQEVRLAGSVGAFDYLGGLYYYDAETSLSQITNGAVFQSSGEENESFSVFGNLDWNITDTLTVSAGLRYIDESKDFFTGYDVALPPGNPLGLPGGTVVPLIPEFTDSVDFDDTITRFAVDWQATPDNLLYASVSEGFRSGGLSIRGTLAEQIEGQTNCAPDNGNAIPFEVLCPENNFLSYEPENVTAYEIGSKNVFFDGQLTFNAAWFMTEAKNFQANDVVVTPNFGPGTTTYINNFPEVEIDGWEFEAVFAPEAVDRLLISATLGIQDGEVTDGVLNGQRVGIGPGGTAGAPGSVADRTGEELIRVADFNYAIRGSYEFDLGPGVVVLAGGYNFIDDHVLGAGFGGVDVEDGYGLLDASIAYEWENYRASLSGRNLTDEDYRLNSLPSVFFQRWADDANWLLEIQAEF